MTAAAFRAAVITVSDSSAAGQRVDLSGPAVVERLHTAGLEIVTTMIVPDDLDLIASHIADLCDAGGIDLIATTGGTGFAPRDVTPEATARVIEKRADGLAELMRSEGMTKNPRAILSRAICGIRGATLIVNLPGSPAGATENLDTVLPLLPHALSLLRGEKPH